MARLKGVPRIESEDMQFYENTYYHLYNRTNNEEALFRSEENYLYFLKKYRYYLDDYLETIGYCLMPTHFHFLVRPKVADDKEHIDVAHLQGVPHLQYLNKISGQIKTLLSSYTKAINKRYNRHGSLFQQNTKAKPISSDKYLITLLTYIHQNPLRAGLVSKPEDWRYSSYQDYIDYRNGSLPNKELILRMIKKEDLKELTENKLLEKMNI